MATEALPFNETQPNQPPEVDGQGDMRIAGNMRVLPQGGNIDRPRGELAQVMDSLQRMSERGASANELQIMTDLFCKLQDRDRERQFSEAKNDARRELPTVLKDAYNQQTQSYYPQLETVGKTIDPVIAKHGFDTSYTEIPGAPEGHCTLQMELAHRCGHSKKYQLTIPLDGKGIKGNVNMTPIHGKASAIAYARRYLKYMAFDLVVAGEDADGNDGPTGTLTSEEAEVIAALYERNQMDRVRFMEWIRTKAKNRDINDITQIPRAIYAEIKANMEARLKRDGKEATNA